METFHKGSVMHMGYVSKNSAIASLFLAIVTLFSNQSAQADTPMTAGVVLEKMPSNEMVVYIAGIVEGMAYARFRKDTLAAGQRDEKGMRCIRKWYHEDNSRILEIESAFRKYEKYPPWVVLAVMIKKECGE